MKIKVQLVLLLAPFLTLAQESTDMESFVNTLSIQNAVVETNAIRTFDNRYKGVAGHPYLLDDLKVLEVVTNNGVNYSVFGNYNLQENVLVLLSKTNALQNIPIHNLKSFSYTESGITSTFIKMNDSFVEDYYKGTNFSIFRQYSKEFSKADYKGAYASGKSQDSFKTEVSYLLSFGNSSGKVKINFGSLAGALNKDEKFLKSLAKEKGLKIKKSEDVLPILKLIDETF